MNQSYYKIIINKKETTHNPEVIEELYPWLKQADFRKAEIKIKNEKFIWQNGVWLDGIFKGDIWHSGIWGNGTWRGNYWEGGFIEGNWSDTPPIDPNFNKDTSSLKTNQISLPKEIRSIRNEVLYTIADKLIRI